MVALPLLLVVIRGIYWVQTEEQDTTSTFCHLSLCRVSSHDNHSKDLIVKFNNLTLNFQRTEHKSRMNKFLKEHCKLKMEKFQTTERPSLQDEEDREVTGLFFFDYRKNQICRFDTLTRHLECSKMSYEKRIRAIDPYNDDMYYIYKKRTIVGQRNGGKSKYSMKGAAHDVFLSQYHDLLIYTNFKSGLFKSKKNFRSKKLLMATTLLSLTFLIRNIPSLEIYYYLIMEKGFCAMNRIDLQVLHHALFMNVPKHFCKREGHLYKVGFLLLHCGRKLTGFDLPLEKEVIIHDEECTKCAVYGQSISCSFVSIQDELSVIMFSDTGEKIRKIALPKAFKYSNFLGISFLERKEVTE